MVLYFSGTGNSRHAAKRIAQLIDDELFSINDAIKTGDNSPIHSERPLVFVTPTYAWRIPRVVSDWMHSTAFSGCRKAYFLQTCGSETHSSIKYSKALCQYCGLTFMGFETLVMPENYVAMFAVTPKEEIPAVLSKAEAKIEKAARLIDETAPLPDEKQCLISPLMSGPVNPLFYKLFVSARGFFASDACIGCGKCERLCPLNNIKLADTHPLWGDNCTHCMACICSCPTEAIEYKRKTTGKPRYLFPEN